MNNFVDLIGPLGCAADGLTDPVATAKATAFEYYSA
jgi:hypothetical protein